MLIPGPLIAAITFPGIVIHEIAHKFFCDMTNVKVYDVCYFQVGDPTGYVIHEPTKDLKHAFLIAIGPLIINSLLCIILTFPFTLPAFALETEDISILSYILGWLGISIGMHAMPSNVDIDGFVEAVKANKGKGLIYFISLPFSWLIKLANILQVIWFDLIYAILLSTIIPLLL
jgi:hypothetical protein